MAARTARLLLAAGLAAVARGAGDVKPIEKVLNMLSELQEKVVREGREEAKTYDKFACFCKESSEEKSEAIEDGQAFVDDLVSEINALTAARVSLDEKIETLNAEIGEISESMAAANKANLEKLKKYQEDRAEVQKAMSSVHEATEFMKSGAAGALPAASLVSQRRSVAKSARSLLQLAAKHGVDAPAYHKTLRLLQGVEDPQVENYAEHEEMAAQLGTMNNLENDFHSQRDQKDAAERKRVAAFTAFMQDAHDRKELKDNELKRLQEKKGKKVGALGQSSMDLTQAQAELHDDQAYLKDLVEKCNSKSDEWDQRTQMRTEELTAITGAIDIITKQVSSKADEKKLLLLPKKSAGKATEDDSGEEEEEEDDDAIDGSTSFAQLAEVRLPTAKKTSGLLAARKSVAKVSQPDASSAGIKAAMDLVRLKGQELKSAMLVNLAAQAQGAGDNFIKIKKLVEELINRLQQEAADDASHKGWCEGELRKAKVSRDDRAAKIAQIDADLERHCAKKATTEDELRVITKALDELSKTMGELTAAREAEKAENEATIEEAKEGQKGIEDAKQILAEFYGKAAFLQRTAQSPEAGNIQAMMDIIISDFTRTIEVTGDNEAKAERDYTELMRSAQTSVDTKKSEEAAKDTELGEVTTVVQAGMSDLKAEQEALDKVLEELLQLQPACIDTGMSHEERLAKRDEEIASLNSALCILDKEGPVKGDMATC